MAWSAKRTYFHVTVQNYDNVDHHFLVPRLSEQADNDDVIVSPVSRPTSSTRPIRYYAKATDQSVSRLRQEQLTRSKQPEADSPPRLISFSFAMRPSGFSEAVSISEGPPAKDRSVATICDFEVDARFKESVSIGPALHPVSYQSRVVCHTTTSKKNYRSSVNYVPRMKPLTYEATQYVRPKRLVTTYISYLDHVTHDNETWYTTTVHFVPTTVHSNVGVTSERLDNDVSPAQPLTNGVASPKTEEAPTADVNMNIIKEQITLAPFRQPPLLISSGPDDVITGDPTAGSKISHRTKMVVKSAPTANMNQEDYIVYLNGYNADVTENGYALNGSACNGYLSDDVTDA